MLRQMEAAELEAGRIVSRLRAAGWSARLVMAVPSANPVGVSVSAGGFEYEGWVDAEEVLRRLYPSLAWSEIDLRAVGLLDEAAVLTLLPAPPRGWTQLRFAAAGPSLAEPMIEIDAPGRVRAWFRHFPCPTSVPIDAGRVPMQLRFVLGTTTLPCRLMRETVRGDALLILAASNRVMIGPVAWCGFRYQTGELKLINEFHGEVPGEVSQIAADVEQLPITLEFVLHEARTTVAQISDFAEGTVVPLTGRPGEVEIRANGMRFGVGELIAVGEQLAVEVMRLGAADAGIRHD
ncbi:FliM/FliN family flagellar motor switch protein [Burkholderia dolosa]|uniref:FliM/FliN family flagellar motor switch protein n=1 Tax=Burkholderia dolosa TaxID=152500 RepID=UPI0015912485|nr:FliM/FliN family flagellar motor switch protein [Burkholderia dolosa]MBR8458396.1 FliM/FliN family flagellar motor switch protein [Burkholderia dolosa]